MAATPRSPSPPPEPGPASGFAISPFTTMSFVDGGQTLNFAGGVVGNGQTWFAGGTRRPASPFRLRVGLQLRAEEIPVGVGNINLGQGVPLPAAAWTGLSTLLGLGLLAEPAKNARKMLA